MKCLDCRTELIEVKFGLNKDGKKTRYYPRVTGRKQIITERRYYCKSCKKEWLLWSKRMHFLIYHYQNGKTGNIHTILKLIY